MISLTGSDTVQDGSRLAVPATEYLGFGSERLLLPVPESKTATFWVVSLPACQRENDGQVLFRRRPFSCMLPLKRAKKGSQHASIP